MGNIIRVSLCKTKHKGRDFSYLHESEYHEEDGEFIWSHSAQTSFIPLRRFPFGFTAKYIINEENRLLVIPQTKIGSDEIYEFDIYKSKWVQYLQVYPDLNTNQTKKMYVQIEDNQDSGKLMEINVHCKKWNVSCKPLVYICKKPYFMVFNNELHLFSCSNKHYIWNYNKRKFRFISKIDSTAQKHVNYLNWFDPYELDIRGVVYIKRKQCLYLFADALYSYSLFDRKWSKLDARIPDGIKDVIITEDDAFILLFCRERIYILYVESHMLVLSALKYPHSFISLENMQLKASLITDMYITPPLLIWGYMRIYAEVEYIHIDLTTVIRLFHGGTHSYVHLVESPEYSVIDGRNQYLVDLNEVLPASREERHGLSEMWRYT